MIFSYETSLAVRNACTQSITDLQNQQKVYTRRGATSLIARTTKEIQRLEIVVEQLDDDIRYFEQIRRLEEWLNKHEHEMGD